MSQPSAADPPRPNEPAGGPRSRKIWASRTSSESTFRNVFSFNFSSNIENISFPYTYAHSHSCILLQNSTYSFSHRPPQTTPALLGSTDTAHSVDSTSSSPSPLPRLPRAYVESISASSASASGTGRSSDGLDTLDVFGHSMSGVYPMLVCVMLVCVCGGK